MRPIHQDRNWYHFGGIMNRYIFILLAALLSSPAVHAKSYVCADLDSSDVKAESRFDSMKPLLQTKIAMFNSDGTIKSEDTIVYITSEKVCDTVVDFKADCQSIERENKFGYDYSFTCRKQNLRGEFYVNEMGDASFTCNGQVQTAMMFGCKTQ